MIINKLNAAQNENNEIEEDIPGGGDMDDDEDEFPDTHVNLNVDGDKLRTRLTSSTGSVLDDASEFLVTSAVPSANSNSMQKIKNKQKKIAKLAKGQPKQQVMKSEKPSLAVEPSPVNRPKRGQHGRKKKLKEKYKFQDDEERELRMKLLRVRHFIYILYNII